MSDQQQNLPQPGDKVTYAPIGTATESSRTTTGTVTDVVTEPTFVGTATAKASKDDPRVVIQNENTGKETAYKPQNIVENQGGRGGDQ